MFGELELNIGERILSQAHLENLVGEAADSMRAEAFDLFAPKSVICPGHSQSEAFSLKDSGEITVPASDQKAPSDKLRRYIVERIRKTGIDIELLPLAQAQAQESYLKVFGQAINSLKLPKSFPHESMLCAQAEAARKRLATLRRAMALEYPEEPILAYRLELGNDETRKILHSRPEFKALLDAYVLTEYKSDAYVRAAAPLEMKISELMQPALNRFNSSVDLPNVRLVFDVTMDYSSRLSAGYFASNTIALGLKSFFLDGGKNAIFDIYHELGHEEQFVKRIWDKADEMNLRRVPQPNEIENLAYKFGFYAYPYANHKFLQDIARIRDGRYLSAAQNSRAKALSVATANYDIGEQYSSHYISNRLEREAILNTHLLALTWRESPHLVDSQ